MKTTSAIHLSEAFQYSQKLIEAIESKLFDAKYGEDTYQIFVSPRELGLQETDKFLMENSKIIAGLAKVCYTDKWKSVKVNIHFMPNSDVVQMFEFVFESDARQYFELFKRDSGIHVIK